MITGASRALKVFWILLLCNEEQRFNKWRHLVADGWNDILIFLWILCYIYILHLADAFIQSDLQCIQVIQFFCQYVCSLGIEPTTFCAANTMLYHWATGTRLFSLHIRLGQLLFKESNVLRYFLSSEPGLIICLLICLIVFNQKIVFNC